MVFDMKKEKQQLWIAVGVTFLVTVIGACVVHISIVRDLEENYQFELEMRREEIAELEMLVNGLEMGE